MNRRKKKRSFWSSRIDYITWSAVNKFLFRLLTRQFKCDVRSSVNRYWGSCSPAAVIGIVLLSMNKNKTCKIIYQFPTLLPGHLEVNYRKYIEVKVCNQNWHHYMNVDWSYMLFQIRGSRKKENKFLLPLNW